MREAEMDLGNVCCLRCQRCRQLSISCYDVHGPHTQGGYVHKCAQCSLANADCVRVPDRDDDASLMGELSLEDIPDDLRPKALKYFTTGRASQRDCDHLPIPFQDSLAVLSHLAITSAIFNVGVVAMIKECTGELLSAPSGEDALNEAARTLRLI